jgi:hypothetical protein
MGIVERIRRLFSEDRTVDTDSARIDKLTSSREGHELTQSEGSGIPPNYLPTGWTRVGRRTNPGGEAGGWSAVVVGALLLAECRVDTFPQQALVFALV